MPDGAPAPTPEQGGAVLPSPYRDRRPLLQDLPATFETRRLLLRCPAEGDGAALHTACQETRLELQTWMDWAHPFPTPEDSEKRCREARAAFMARTDFEFLMQRKEDGLLVGGCGLHRFEPAVPSAEVGYWRRAQCAGQGLVTEAVRALQDIAFRWLQLERLCLRCDDLNARSAAVAERTGFVWEGTLRHDRRDAAGALRFTRVYALLRDQWEGGRQ